MICLGMEDQRKDKDLQMVIWMSMQRMTPEPKRNKPFKKREAHTFQRKWEEEHSNEQAVVFSAYRERMRFVT